MDNEFLSKLLGRIDYKLLEQFQANDIKELGFVPAIVQNDFLYVLISTDSDEKKVLDLVKKTKPELTPKPMPVTPSQFEDFVAEVISKLKNNSPKEEPKEEKVEIKNDEKKKEDNNNEEITPGDISKVKSPEKKKIGEILVEEKLLTESQIQEALVKSKSMGYPLGSTLVKLGYITLKQLKDALAAQMQVDMVTDEQMENIQGSVPCLADDFVQSHKVVPMYYNGKTLTIGMVNPKDKDTINQIIGMTGLKPYVYTFTAIEYDRYLEQYYKRQDREEHKKTGYRKEKSALESLTEEIQASGEEQNQEQSLWQRVQSDIEDISSNAAKYANMIVTQAIDQRASDIHIEPRLDGYVARYRIDGTLNEVVKIPASLESQIVSRFKVLSKMNIAEHRRPQDGNFTIKYNNKSYDFRINTLPVSGKEKMVIRILAPSMRAEQSYSKDIEVAGAFPDDIEKIKYLTSAPNGIVLMSGPTGSGKTTTLYAILKTLNSPDVNITTIEDPVEIRLDGVNQSAVNPKAGITFASCMRAILRQDPDIILVGEIRDYETLETAISASLTGHFVLSTVHTNSTAATVTRLIEMGAKDYLVSSTLNGVLAQRLVKRLCPHCKEAYHPTEEEAKKLFHDPAKIKEFMESTIYRPAGCPECGNTGFLGRLAILEILVVTKEIKKLIASHAHDIEIEEHAVKHGMRTLRESCIKHILEGNTSVSEFVRVLGLVGE